jgi:hypothetical protein
VDDPPSAPPDPPLVDVSDGGPGRTEVGADAIRALAAMMDEPDTDPAGYAAPPPRPAEPQAPQAVVVPLSAEACEALNRASRIVRLRDALVQVARALAYVHGRGLVHRDIKPSNIMVDDARRARLMDFGLVKASREGSDALTQTGRVVGTYRYMSPEQAQGQSVDGRSDLYSLGVILYELLAGVPPFTSADPVALWREILHVRPPAIAWRNPGADPSLATIAERLLEKDPARRLQSGAEVLAALGV